MTAVVSGSQYGGLAVDHDGKAIHQHLSSTADGIPALQARPAPEPLAVGTTDDLYVAEWTGSGAGRVRSRPHSQSGRQFSRCSSPPRTRRLFVRQRYARLLANARWHSSSGFPASNPWLMQLAVLHG